MDASKSEFHSPSYKSLIESLTPLKLKYKTANIDKKKDIAQNEIHLWKKYISDRSKELPEYQKITPDQLKDLRDIFTKYTVLGLLGN